MKIGIIGAGNIGGTLAQRFSALGHEVAVANSRDPATLAELSEKSGARAVWASEAAKDADLLVITIPEKDIPGLPAGICDGAASDLVIVDTGNYYPRQRDGLIAAIEEGMPESVWVEEQLGVSVIKAFNGIQAQHLLEKGMPPGSPERIALPIAGDDAAAKAVVMALVDDLGFDPVDAGSLAESWRQQPGSPVYGADANVEGVRKALAAANKERTSEWKA